MRLGGSLRRYVGYILSCLCSDSKLRYRRDTVHSSELSATRICRQRAAVASVADEWLDGSAGCQPDTEM